MNDDGWTDERQERHSTKKSNNTMTKKNSNHHTKRSTKKADKKKKKPPIVKCERAIVFDAAARRAHLCGFAQRKAERRRYGHAQQHVKDRQAKLERRAERRQAQQEQIALAEAQRGAALLALPSNQAASVETQVLWDGVETQQQWGGAVVVVTSTHIPGDSDDEASAHPPKQQPHQNTDTEQLYAGKVEKYLKRATATTTKQKAKTQFRRGQHGATHMFKSAADLKVAQKMLQRSSQKGTSSKGKPATHPRRRGGPR